MPSPASELPRPPRPSTPQVKEENQMRFKPTWQSLTQHGVPSWFDDAKLGVLIHWGPATIPAWAPIDGNLHQLINEKGFAYYFAHNPYVEWYYNTIRIHGSPSQKHHLETYGADFSYFDFAPLFNQGIENWNPDDWADLFQQSGMRYAILVTKHHDGFLLWPSQRPNPHHRDYQTSRDVTGELTAAVRQRGMKMGLYYSGGLDWTFNNSIIRDIPSHFGNVEQSPEFIAYVDAHWRELIDRYRPSVLWGDIAYPAAADLPKLFADYYNLIPDGLVNDRFAQELPDDLDFSEAVINPTNKHFDFITPEYSSFNQIRQAKWECTRGIGYSYAYNVNETLDTHLSFAELVHLLVDVVSKNGNLLLGVGPMSDGTIPPLQKQRLEELGGWLNVNGEAIFETRPWVTAEATTAKNLPIRFTQKGAALYAITLGTPTGQCMTINALQVKDETTIHLLGYDEALVWRQQGDSLTVVLPETLHPSPAYAFKIIPTPCVDPGIRE